MSRLAYSARAHARHARCVRRVAAHVVVLRRVVDDVEQAAALHSHLVAAVVRVVRAEVRDPDRAVLRPIPFLR